MMENYQVEVQVKVENFSNLALALTLAFYFGIIPLFQYPNLPFGCDL
jgi:hypothetical protein